jgi:DNA (cytosine-5)-methyltransferase 1
MKKIKVGSDFSGVGAFNQSLIRLGVDYKEVFACDWDKYSRQTFELNYGLPNYFPKDVYEREIPKESLDIYMTSPPCQSFSIAGKRLGKVDKRGILFFNSLEFIQENKPRYFIFENVKGLLSHDKVDKSAEYGRTFQEWINYLGGKSVNGVHTFFPYEDSIPYHIYFQCLNAKHYGIPQNRERIFIIGIRDDEDNDFQFPKPFPLEKRLKDVLESEVDEKYFLSDKMVNGLFYTSSGKNASFPKAEIKDLNLHSACLTSRMAKMGRADNYIGVDSVGFINQDTQASQVFSENGTSPSICAGTHGYALGYVETELNQVASLYENNADAGRVYDTNSVSCTLKSDGGGGGAKTGLYLVESEPKILGYTRDGKGKVSSRHKKDLCGTIHTSSGGGGSTDQFVIIPTNNSKGFYQAEEEEDSINFSVPSSKTRRGRVGKKVSQTLDTQCNQAIFTQQRIRRLTPRECFRLMDFNEDMIERTINSKLISDSQLYKQAGNSICVGVLAAIINKLKLT